MDVEVGRKYRHFKGMVVTVLCVAKDSEDLKEKVVYEHDGQYWVRDKEMFLSKVDHEKYPEVKEKYRFTLLD